MKENIKRLAFSIGKNENAQIKFDKDTLNENKFALKRFSTNAKKVCFSYRNLALHRTLKNLANDNTIKICKYDKGKDTAIFDSLDYYSKLESTVCDQSKFVQVNQNTKEHRRISKKNLLLILYVNT